MNVTDSDRNWTEIVLSGGSCSGKTTTKGYLATELTRHDFVTLVAPEVATMVMDTGVDIGTISGSDPTQFLRVEEVLITCQWQIRQTMRALAETYTKRRVIIIYDRSEIDVAAYIGNAQFDALASTYGRSLEQCRDSYETVIHLVTAAIGAEAAYSSASNVRRYEDVEQARVMDRRILDCWNGHSNVHVLDNSAGLAGKFAAALQIVLNQTAGSLPSVAPGR